MTGSPLARELYAIYTALIVYATLHPLTGWRDQGISPIAWTSIWPKVFLTGDLTFNLLAYVPLGMFVVWAVFPLLRGVLAVAFAVLAGLALSFMLESLQTYLPTRIPSLADLAANGLGALVGAVLGALLAITLRERGILKRVGDDWFGARTPRGLILAGLWLFASLYPQSMLFGHGSVVSLIGPVSGYPFTPVEFARVEAAVTAASLFAAGALLGAVMIVWFGGGRLIAIGRRWFDAAPGSTRALILAALWLSGLLFPESILFGHGSVLAYVGPVSGYPFTPAEFVRVETAVTAASLFAAGSLGMCALRPSAPRLVLVVVFCVGACAVRALSQAILFPPEHAWAWLTPGALRGLGAGVVGLMLTVALPRPMRLALIAITVTFATVVVNLAPPNPYYLSTVQVLNPGRFLNFNGLTQLVSAAWPFLVVLYIPFALVGGQREA